MMPHAISQMTRSPSGRVLGLRSSSRRSVGRKSAS